ncbi:hypothetical protein I7I50_05112 [Histoplasma capsulatum G186AR]|uniref:Uncharacterized protein n=1 Tax=Ajellomyces capsulatus TaxID=5037 RepID=A0A8H8D8G3_AJECA|nr:hypothetical protein I7I52_03370 [Histoplasma capsulatum]QSS75838.1 hypothetical protein I7I50_05112 [Histoplasma capsulatum G186AR]
MVVLVEDNGGKRFSLGHLGWLPVLSFPVLRKLDELCSQLKVGEVAFCLSRRIPSWCLKFLYIYFNGKGPERRGHSILFISRPFSEPMNQIQGNLVLSNRKLYHITQTN